MNFDIKCIPGKFKKKVNQNMVNYDCNTSGMFPEILQHSESWRKSKMGWLHPIKNCCANETYLRGDVRREHIWTYEVALWQISPLGYLGLCHHLPTLGHRKVRETYRIENEGCGVQKRKAIGQYVLILGKGTGIRARLLQHTLHVCHVSTVYI